MLNEFLARRVFYGFLPSNSQKGCYPIQAKPTTLGAQRRWIVYGSSAVAPFVNLPCCCMDSPWAVDGPLVAAPWINCCEVHAAYAGAQGTSGSEASQLLLRV